jgi:hypothetical protein
MDPHEEPAAAEATLRRDCPYCGSKVCAEAGRGVKRAPCPSCGRLVAFPEEGIGLRPEGASRRGRGCLIRFLLSPMLLVVIGVAVVGLFGLLAGLSITPDSFRPPEGWVADCFRDYASAQKMFKRNDWDGDGLLEYAPDLRELHGAKDMAGKQIQLINESMASARGSEATPWQGYLFLEMKTVGGKPIDWAKDFALCAVPSQYGKTGWLTYIVKTDGRVWSRDSGTGEFVADFPADPESQGWTMAQ